MKEYCHIVPDKGFRLKSQPTLLIKDAPVGRPSETLQSNPLLLRPKSCNRPLPLRLKKSHYT